MSGDAPTPSLAMLAAAITDLASKVESLETRNTSDSGSPAHLESRVRALEAVLTDVRKAVTKLVQRKAAEDAQQEMRRPWHMLTSEQAEQRWLELRAWVGWFVVRNNIGPKEIPDCWYLHGGLIDELEALRWAWIDTNKPDSRGVDPIWWREAVHRARPRWPLFNPNGCGTTHTQTRPRVMADEREWEMFLSEELANHPDDRPARAS